jgi:RNA polymerase sigma factor (sigma-70 family)
MPDPRPQDPSDTDRFDRRYRPALMSFFLRRLHNPVESEDLTQEVLTKLTVGGGPAMQHPDAYVFQAAANLLRDRKRREDVRGNYRATVEVVEGESTDFLGPERVVAGRQALSQVLAALQELPEKTCNIFILHRLEKLKKGEIADMFGLSLSGIDKHLLKAMTHLHHRLRDRL